MQRTAVVTLGSLLVALIALASFELSPSVASDASRFPKEPDDTRPVGSELQSVDPGLDAIRSVAGGDKPREPVGLDPRALNAAAAVQAAVRTRIRLDDPEGWFRVARSGSLKFHPPGHLPETLPFELDEAGRTEVLLSTRPTTPGEFPQVKLGGWSPALLRVEVDPDGVPALVLGPAPGARFAWDPHVPLGDHGPVEVIGGLPFGPDVHVKWSVSGMASRKVARDGLPFVLPRLSMTQRVWIRSAGHAWRRYTVGPSTESVHVRLFGAATLRVLHDGPPRARSVSVTSLRDRIQESIVDASPVVFEGVGCGDATVRFVEDDGTGVHVVQRNVELIPGEVVEFDLRANTRAVTTGVLRVTVAPTRLPAAVESSDLELAVLRRAEGATPRWRVVAERRPTEEPSRAPALALEATDLLPGEVRALLRPLGWMRNVEVRAGVVTEIKLGTPALGRVSFTAKNPEDVVLRRFRLWTAEDDPRDRIHLRTSRETGLPSAPYALAPGTYTAMVEGGFTLYACAPFEVHAGETTHVHLQPTTTHALELRAVDAVTHAPLHLDKAFWRGCLFRDARTNDPVDATVNGEGSGDEIAISARFVGQSGELLITLPEHEHFAFDPVGPIDPAAGQALVIWGRAH